ncbi:hypothetical protein [Streptomyces europaeiscabiei]|uniref:hypothetical protein n=1 Tax=Streptomyces europaeiscabiei TaxID=146819 RepID=UPI002E118F60|nr:hypothetical protein OHB30_50575 [Streptomyces europaeiscabiei]
MFRTTGALVAAALGASIALTPTPASAGIAWQCYGTQVKRCAAVWWDNNTTDIRARAKITDVAGGGSYQVKVTNVKLVRPNGTGGWVTVRSAKDYDGWHDTEDLAGTTSFDPCDFPQREYSVVATFSWRGASSGEKTWHPSNGLITHCE